MLSSVTISLVEEARGGPFVFWHDLDHACQRAKELGFDALEVFPPSPEAVTKAEVGRKLQHHGLKLAAVGTGAGWVKHRLHLVLPDVTARAHARNFIRSIIDVAGALGAPAILGSMQGRWGEGVTKEVALGYLADALEDLGTYAQQYGVPFLYEPLNRYETNLATTVETSLQLLHRLSTKNVKLLCDLFHMNIEETNLAEALKLGGERVGHIHFVDSNRRAAGFGHLDFGPIVGALRQIGYRGYLSAEVLPLPDSDAAARQTIAAFRQWTNERTVAAH